MINNIKLVSGFAHRDKSNIFSNVLIKDGFMTAQNELTGISVAVDCDIDFCCNADRLNQSLINCDPEKLKLSIKNSRVYIVSGRFKSNIELIPVDNYPLIDNSGDSIDIQPDIISQLSSITQFTDPNDIRIALQGVALTDGFIKATNGHMAIKKTIQNISGIDELIIPTKSLQSMIKANTIIKSMTVKNKMVFFNFEDGYVFTKTLDHKMPDIDKILCEMSEQTDISLLQGAIKSIAALCGDSRTIILGNTIQNQNGDASIGGFNLKETAFNADYLLKIIDIADFIDFSKYPGPCPFIGSDIKGAIVGIKI